jgi:hypothetical protein
VTPQAPDPAALRFALDQFGEDARRWRELSDVCETASRAADGLALRSVDFGMVAIVHSAYSDVQQLVATLLSDGATECDAIASNLIAARDTYQREEDANVHLFKGIW